VCQDKQVHVAVRRVRALGTTAEENGATGQWPQFPQQGFQSGGRVQDFELADEGMAIVGCVKVHPPPPLSQQQPCLVQSSGGQVDRAAADADALDDFPFVERLADMARQKAQHPTAETEVPEELPAGDEQWLL
jgi:hypothetical protein